VKGKVHRLEASGQGLRGVVCPAGRERGEGGVKARCCRVYLGRGVGSSKCRLPLPLGDQERDRGKVLGARTPREDLQGKVTLP